MSDTNTTRARVEAALAERLKARIGPNAGILADDLLDDLIAAGGVLLPVRPNGIVWVIHRRRAVSATVMFAGVGADGLAAFSVLRGRLGTTAWSSMNFTEHDIGKAVFLTREDAEAALAEQEDR